MCNNVLKGWAGNACQRFTANNAAAICKSDNTCATNVNLPTLDFPYCQASAATVASCPSMACVDPMKCVAGQQSSTGDTIAEICKADNSVCGTNLVCAAGACKTANGIACGTDPDCASGHCGGAVKKCCSTSCNSPCFDCAVSGFPAGACTGTCNTAGGCTNSGGCSPVACQNKVKGWASNNRACEFYSSNTPSGVCTSRSDSSLMGMALGACAAIG
jgi:hypothetical protein